MLETKEGTQNWMGTTSFDTGFKFKVIDRLPAHLPVIGARSSTKRYDGIVDALMTLDEGKFLSIEEIEYSKSQNILSYLRYGKSSPFPALKKEGLSLLARYDKKGKTIYIWKASNKNK